MFGMKHSIFIVAIWAFIYVCRPINGMKLHNAPPKIEFNISKELEEEFFNVLRFKNTRLPYKIDASGRILANVTDFADKIFKNVGVFAVNHGLDPMPLSGFDQGFLTAHITLTNGTLNGISTISRYEDVNVEYSPTTKTAQLDIPIMFDDIGFTYQYHIVIFLIGPKGTMIGHIKNCKAYVTLSFDFNSYTASVHELKMKDSGHASITFVGGVVEIIVDLFSEFLSVVLHPFIIAVVEGIVKSVAHYICDGVNDALNGTFVSPNEAQKNITNFAL